MRKPNKYKGKVRYDKQVKEAAKSTAAPEAAPVSDPPPRQAEPADAPPSPVVSLTPLAPLIIRSGRPFDDQVGADAAQLPPPSTIAGCLRTAWLRSQDFDFAKDQDGLAAAINDMDLRSMAVAGPLLARPTNQGGLDLLVPKPADAHYYGADVVRAEPGPFIEGCGGDWPTGLHPVLLTRQVQGKPSKGPAWWAWEDLLAFRQNPTPPAQADLQQRGWSPPQDDRRTHVAIDSATLAAASGRLFQTAGLDLEIPNLRLKEGYQPGLRLIARCAKPLAASLVHLGGERRLAYLEPQPPAYWPTPPADWFTQIQAAKGLTLTLLTAACFEAGYRPGWLGQNLAGEPPTAPGVRLQLVAVACERWQPHSGWDLARREARATRKLVAAGATYWFRLLDGASAESLAPLWLASICDSTQDQHDGFGLALPAPWKPTV